PRATNTMRSAVRATVSLAGTARPLTADRASRLGLRTSNAATGSLWCATNARRAFARACRSMRRLPAGHGGPIGVRRMHPSATGAPPAPREGGREVRKEEGRESWKKGEAEGWLGAGAKKL